MKPSMTPRAQQAADNDRLRGVLETVRDKLRVKELSAEVDKFLSEMNDLQEQIKQRYAA